PRLSDVKSLFRIVTGRLGAVNAAPIRRNTRDGEVSRLPSVLVISVHVGDIKSGILQQPNVLACAGERRAFVVGRAHVAAAEGLVRTGARNGLGFHLDIPMREQRTR